MILRVQVGSEVHGTAVAGQDDWDEMGGRRAMGNRSKAG